MYHCTYIEGKKNNNNNNNKKKKVTRRKGKVLTNGSRVITGYDLKKNSCIILQLKTLLWTHVIKENRRR